MAASLLSIENFITFGVDIMLYNLYAYTFEILEHLKSFESNNLMKQGYYQAYIDFHIKKLLRKSEIFNQKIKNLNFDISIAIDSLNDIFQKRFLKKKLNKRVNGYQKKSYTALIKELERFHHELGSLSMIYRIDLDLDFDNFTIKEDAVYKIINTISSMFDKIQYLINTYTDRVNLITNNCIIFYFYKIQLLSIDLVEFFDKKSPTNLQQFINNTVSTLRLMSLPKMIHKDNLIKIKDKIEYFNDGIVKYDICTKKVTESGYTK